MTTPTVTLLSSRPSAHPPTTPRRPPFTARASESRTTRAATATNPAGSERSARGHTPRALLA